VVELLQRIHTHMQPSPQRIIWLYKRWQPLYDVIRTTVVPRVEFIKGVPLNLEKDDFLNTDVRNLIVLDDMATDASKDSRITDLFTEGSHHRNLSVIALNQNLYFSKDPTQRRNCHYLILFNNAVDRQPVMTLARQMYPNNPRELLRHFEDAVGRPFGYLLVDLKPTTPETMRMRTDIFATPNSDVSESYPLTESSQTRIPEAPHTCPIINTTAVPTALNPTVADVEDHSREVAPCDQFGSNRKNLPHATMFSCDDCGVVFEHCHDLQHHVKRWCSEGDNRSDEPPRKRAKYDYEEDDDSFLRLDEENTVYKKIFQCARDHNEEDRRRKIDKYEQQGLSVTKAKDKANRALRDEDVRAFLVRYASLLSMIFRLRGGYLHGKIMTTVEEYLEQHMDLKKAIRLSLKKFKHHVEEIMEETEDDVSDDDTDDDTSSEDGSEDEEEDD